MRIFLLLFLLNFQALAGGWIGNGGGTTQDLNNIWFLGDKTVEYCVHISPDFPQPKTSTINKQVELAIEKWKDFFKSYNLQYAKFGLPSQSNSSQFLDKIERPLSLNFREITDCQGKEDAIEFLFGVDHPVVQKAQEMGQKYALGLSLRRDFDHKNYRNGGLIWIKNFTSDWNKIFHLLLHEVGHTFGMKHNSVFVMDANIANTFSDSIDGNNYSAWFGSIENPGWKYNFIENDSWLLAGTKSFGGVPLGFPNSSIPEEIRKMIGMGPAGSHQIIVKMNTATSSNSKKSFNLIIREQKIGKFYEMVGKFGMMQENQFFPIGPSLFTEWLDINVKGEQENTFSNRFLDHKSPVLPTDGYVEFNGTKFAASLFLENGLVLKVFAPQSGMWWEARAFSKQNSEQKTSASCN